jgi:pimeloyl-ACP methyl ester carboxylesterase
VGISMGGFIAQTLALDHAARVDRLVLCSTSLSGRFIHERPTPGDETRVAHLRACATFDRSADVGRITSPALVVAGTADILVPPANARLLADAIPGARLLLYEGAGHVLILERAREFNRDLAGFLCCETPHPCCETPYMKGER